MGHRAEEGSGLPPALTPRSTVVCQQETTASLTTGLRRCPLSIHRLLTDALLPQAALHRQGTGGGRVTWEECWGGQHPLTKKEQPNRRAFSHFPHNFFSSFLSLSLVALPFPDFLPTSVDVLLCMCRVFILYRALYTFLSHSQFCGSYFLVQTPRVSSFPRSPV